MARGDQDHPSAQRRLALAWTSRTPSRRISARHKGLELIEVVLMLGGRVAGLFFGSLLIVFGILAVESPVGATSLVAPVALIGAGTTLLKFGGRPPDACNQGAELLERDVQQPGSY